MDQPLVVSRHPGLQPVLVGMGLIPKGTPACLDWRSAPIRGRDIWTDEDFPLMAAATSRSVNMVPLRADHGVQLNEGEVGKQVNSARGGLRRFCACLKAG